MSGLLIAAEIQELIAVTHDGFPLLFEQSLKLRKVLDYDTAAYLTESSLSNSSGSATFANSSIQK